MSDEKKVIVTGSSRGIGKAIAETLSAAGYRVVTHSVRSGGTDLVFDVADRSAAAEALGAWVEANGAPYGVVLNAGIAADNAFPAMEDGEWDRVVRTDLDGFYNVTRAVLQPMLLKKSGRIINVASLSGLKGLPGQTNYSAAKGGLIAATKALAQEVARKKVTVNAIAPGFVRTDMVEGLDEATLKKDIPMQRFGEPEEVAALIAFLASPDAAYITGQCISINGGLYS